jgi:tetratricopeptide (TPR) repeat protein
MIAFLGRKGGVVRLFLACVASVAISAPASAAWNVAESKHFVIYADESPRQLNDFATQLERFDQAVRYATRMGDPEIGKGNRLTVFVLPSQKDVQSIMGDKTGFFAGFYTGRVAGSLAYVPKQVDYDDPDKNSIFFHEYTHHLMKQDLERPYPEWYVEGYAEFFSTPQFERDGSVWLGRVVQGRAYGLFEGPQLPLETLLHGMQPGMTNEQRDVYYGRSWLLAHYLLLDQHRSGQLTAYLNAMSSGASSIDAAHQVFGDLKQLDTELNAYERKPLLKFQIPASAIHLQPITVRPLSAGGAQVIMARARIKNGVKSTEIEQIAAQLRSVEGQYSGDELVETTLGEAELDAGHPQAAEAAADRALKSNSQSLDALVLKGKAVAARADQVEGDGRHALFDEARASFIAANKLDTEDPEPLYEFYGTFLHEGVRPTPNALAALHYASDLAPQDLGVRMNSAIAYLNEGKPKEARASLIVVAYSPHVEQMGEVARRMIADIDAGTPRAALQETRRAASAATSPR